MDVKKLIEEVLSDLGNNLPLEAITSKVQIIARLLKNDKFNSWVSKEFLSGYGEEDVLPSYRISISPDIVVDYMAPQGFGAALVIKNQSVPIMNLGQDVYYKVMSIRLTAALPIVVELSKKTDSISMSLSPYERGMVQRVLGNAQIISCHKVLSPSCFTNIIESVKAKLIDIFFDFDEKLFDNSIDFNAINKKDDVQRIVNNYFPNVGVVNAGAGQISVQDSTIISGVSNNVTGGSTQKTIEELLDKICELVHEIELNNSDFVDTVLQIKAELKQDHPRKSIIKMGFNALKGLLKTAAVSGVEEIIEEGISNANLFA